MDRDVCAVEYALTEDDLVAFANVPFTSRFLFRLSAATLWFFGVLGAIMIFLALGLLWGSVDRWHDPEFRRWVLAVIAATLICGFVFERPLLIFILRRRIRAGRYKWLMQQCRLSLSAKGVTWKTQTIETSVQWSEIAKVAASQAGAYLLTPTRRGFVVPRRIFPDAAAFAEFVRTAQQLHRDYGRS